MTLFMAKINKKYIFFVRNETSQTYNIAFITEICRVSNDIYCNQSNLRKS